MRVFTDLTIFNTIFAVVATRSVPIPPDATVKHNDCKPHETFFMWEDVRCFDSYVHVDEAHKAIYEACDSAITCSKHKPPHPPYEGRGHGVIANALLRDSCGFATPNLMTIETCHHAFKHINVQCHGHDPSRYYFGQATSRCDGSTISVHQAPHGCCPPGEEDCCDHEHPPSAIIKACCSALKARDVNLTTSSDECSAPVKWTQTCDPHHRSVNLHGAMIAIQNACEKASHCYNTNFAGYISGSGWPANGIRATIRLGDHCGESQKQDFTTETCVKHFNEINTFCGRIRDSDRFYLGQAESECDHSIFNLTHLRDK